LDIKHFQDDISSAEGSIEPAENQNRRTRIFVPDDYPKIAELNFVLNLDAIKPPPEEERTLVKLHEYADRISREQGFLP